LSVVLVNGNALAREGKTESDLEAYDIWMDFGGFTVAWQTIPLTYILVQDQ